MQKLTKPNNYVTLWVQNGSRQGVAVGGNQSHNNVQSSQTKYVWTRTA